MERLRKQATLALWSLLLAACSGAPGANHSSFLPEAVSNARYATVTPADGRRLTAVGIRVTIPRRHRHTSVRPATISAGTQSISIQINAGAIHVFNVTAGSRGCTTSMAGTTCTLSVAAPIGTDVFSVNTYSGTNGGGAILDHAAPATVDIRKATANKIAISLSPVVSTTADSGPGSLRYAIANAVAGDTILFLIPSSSTITLSSPIALEGVTVAGPGYTSNNGSYSGIIVSGNSAHQTFTVGAGVTATISGLILANGNATAANGATAPGGAVSNAGTLTLLNDALIHNASSLAAPAPPSGCATYHEGGAVYNNGSLTVTNSTFDTNEVASDVFSSPCAYGAGGAIFNDTKGVLSVSGSEFDNNVAYEGGAVFNFAANGSASFSNDRFASNQGCNLGSGCATTGCTGSGCTSYPKGLGAAIYDAAGHGVSITASKFDNNVAGGGNGAANTTSVGYGGALYLVAGSPHVSSSSFESNQAGGGTTNCSFAYGGAIYATVPLEIDGSHFTGNTASGDYGAQGGAILENGGAITGTNDVFATNTAQGFGGSTCAPNAGGGGGAILSQNAVTLSNTQFSGDSALGTSGAFAGGLYAGGNATLTTVTFTGEEALASGANGAAPLVTGGAVYNFAALQLSGCTFTSNVADAQGSNATGALGGAIYGEGSITASNATVFTTNKALVGATSNGYAFGGGIYAGAAIASSNDTFGGNTATGSDEAAGGALFIAKSISSSGDSFGSNSIDAVSSLGGAIYVGIGVSGSLTDDGFTQNKVQSTAATPIAVGGAIADYGGLSITSSTISTNQAATAGGGIFAGQTELLSGSTVENNRVLSASGKFGGGGIYNSNGTMEITATTIYDNQVTLASGAAQAGGGGVSAGYGLDMNQSLVYGNNVFGNVSGNGGGGILLTNGAAITNSTIFDNGSSVDGGGVLENTSGTTVLLNDTIYQNTAAGNGGNVDEPAGTLVLANDILAGGAAGATNGGADLNTFGGTLTDDDYNLFQYPVTGNGLSGAHDITLADPKLGGLADNGGPTLTLADSSASPGYQWIPFSGSGSSSTCGGVSGPLMESDQRGYQRGGTTCDVGAYDSGATAPAIRVRAPRRPKSSTHYDPRIPLPAPRQPIIRLLPVAPPARQ